MCMCVNICVHTVMLQSVCKVRGEVILHGACSANSFFAWPVFPHENAYNEIFCLNVEGRR